MGFKNNNGECMSEQKEEKIIVYQLNEEVIKRLEKLVGVPHVSKDTTELQAGYMLGIQFVLSKLREGIHAK